MSFEVGRLYRRRQLHEDYGGQQRGGISTPARHPFILLFTGETGRPFGYADWWDADGLFHYYGEGQKGNMEFRAGNKAIRDHAKNGEDVHLFEITKKSGYVRYLGEMVYVGHDLKGQTKDVDGHLRTAIVFRLRPL